MTEPWNQEEATRLTIEAGCIETEFLDTEEMGARIDAEIRDGLLTRDGAAQEKALAENRRLAELCLARQRLWRGLGEALEVRDISLVRAKAEAIRQTAEDTFRRRQA